MRTIFTSRIARAVMAGAALALAAPSGAVLAQEKVLKAVMHADVRVIDPIWTTQTIANIHGMLVYDTLFGNDSKQVPRPQMVGKYELSADKLTPQRTITRSCLHSRGFDASR